MNKIKIKIELKKLKNLLQIFYSERKNTKLPWPMSTKSDKKNFYREKKNYHGP